MRFMILVKANADSEAGKLPDQREFAERDRFNEELVKAGVLLAADGLQASSKGARIRYGRDTRTVLNGPFTETRELIAGYWLIQASSLAEAVEWMRRAPFQQGEVEIRQVFEAEDLTEAPA